MNTPGVQVFLSEVRRHLHLDAPTEGRVMVELTAHFQDKLQDLRGSGLREPDAEREAIASFGGARHVARLMYEAYGQGSWVDALIGCQPHLIAAWMFASHLWRLPVALALGCVAFAVITILGWRAGSPTWTYSWAGYALFPPLVLAYLLRSAPFEALSTLAAGGALLPSLARIAGTLVLYAGTLGLLVAAAVRVCRRDWILVSLILLPFSVLGIWTYGVERTGDVLFGAAAIKQVGQDRSMAWMCVILGAAAALFIRMRPRLLKGVVVVVMGMVGGTVVVLSLHDGMRLGGALAVSLILFLVMMSPMVLTALTARPSQMPRTPKEAPAG